MLSIVERAEPVAYAKAEAPRGGDEHRSAAVTGNTVANVLRALLCEATAAGASDSSSAVVDAVNLLRRLEGFD